MITQYTHTATHAYNLKCEAGFLNFNLHISVSLKTAALMNDVECGSFCKV